MAQEAGPNHPADALCLGRNHVRPLFILGRELPAESPALRIDDHGKMNGKDPEETEQKAEQRQKAPAPHSSRSLRGKREHQSQPEQDQQKEIAEIDPDQERDAEDKARGEHPDKPRCRVFCRQHIGRQKHKKIQHGKERHVVAVHLAGHHDHQGAPEERDPRTAPAPQENPERKQSRDQAEDKEEDPQHRVAWPRDLKHPDNRVKPEHIVPEEGVRDRPLTRHQP